MKMTIDGEPVSQARMKYSGHNGIVRVYDPRDKQKKIIREAIKQAFSGMSYIQHPRISFVFHMPIPASIRKRDAQMYISGMLKHEKKPDVDNFIKLYLDCMDGICFEGDQKVSLGLSVKLYSSHPKTIIFIHETSQLMSTKEKELLEEESEMDSQWADPVQLG